MAADTGTKAAFKAPPLSCDTHFHVFGPNAQRCHGAVVADGTETWLLFGCRDGHQVVFQVRVRQELMSTKACRARRTGIATPGWPCCSSVTWHNPSLNDCMKRGRPPLLTILPIINKSFFKDKTRLRIIVMSSSNYHLRPHKDNTTRRCEARWRNRNISRKAERE